MNHTDFSIGQKIVVVTVNSVKELSITKIGHKYLTLEDSTQIEIKNFKVVYKGGGVAPVCYLTMDIWENKLRMDKLRTNIEMLVRKNIIFQMSLEDLETVNKILEKYL